MILDWLKKYYSVFFIVMSLDLFLCLILDCGRRQYFAILIIVPFCIFHFILYLFFKFISPRKMPPAMEIMLFLDVICFLMNSIKFFVSPRENFIYGEGNCILFAAFFSAISCTKKFNISGSWFKKDDNE